MYHPNCLSHYGAYHNRTEHIFISICQYPYLSEVITDRRRYTILNMHIVAMSCNPDGLCHHDAWLALGDEAFWSHFQRIRLLTEWMVSHTSCCFTTDLSWCQVMHEESLHFYSIIRIGSQQQQHMFRSFFPRAFFQLSFSPFYPPLLFFRLLS